VAIYCRPQAAQPLQKNLSTRTSTLRKNEVLSRISSSLMFLNGVYADNKHGTSGFHWVSFKFCNVQIADIQVTANLRLAG
jgi:hypothetical protein